MNLLRVAILFLFIISIASCDNSDEYVPYVKVQTQLELSSYNDLLISGNSMKLDMYKNGFRYGYAGIIIFCEFHDDITPSNSKYHIYDACCTHEMSTDCSVEVEDGTFTATCPCCGTVYSLNSGFPSGDSVLTSIPLKRYNYSLLSGNSQGEEVLYIYN